jgi:hypothetical protein
VQFAVAAVLRGVLILIFLLVRVDPNPKKSLAKLIATRTPPT